MGRFLSVACGIKGVTVRVDAPATELTTMDNQEALLAEIQRLKAENENLKKPARGQLSLKVSEKGALSVYGMGRFPVTLYREQWEKLLSMSDQIKEFIAQNDAALKKKE